jgi:AcrR family transcriptional regulator
MPTTPEDLRRADPDARRQAVLKAGLAVFAAEGYAAARLDDVAKRAGVAKGTIYLYFRDKQDLFEQIVIGAIGPLFERVETIGAQEAIPFPALLAAFYDLFRREVLGTERKEIMRLVITEGRRFPEIAKFYHREVVSRGLKLMSAAARRAQASGDLASDTAERFPHLIFAPLLFTVLWDGLFSSFDPLDVEGLLVAHRQLLLGSSGNKDQQS